MANDSTELLVGAWEETGDVHEADYGNVKGVAHANEPGCLVRGIDIQHTGEVVGLLGDDADGLSGHSGKPHDNVLGEEAVVNLSHHVLFDSTPLPYSRQERLQSLANTVLFNIRGLTSVRTLVEGQEPVLGSRATTDLAARQWHFAKSLLR